MAEAFGFEVREARRRRGQRLRREFVSSLGLRGSAMSTYPAAPKEIWPRLRWNNEFGTSAVIVKRSVLFKFGGFRADLTRLRRLGNVGSVAAA
jgi:hypothetical protein